MIRQTNYHPDARLAILSSVLLLALFLVACNSGGSNSNSAEKPTFAVKINSPVKSTFHTSEPTSTSYEVRSFEGSATDVTDGEITANKLVWTYTNVSSGLEYNFNDSPVDSGLANKTTGQGIPPSPRISKTFPAGKYIVHLTATNSRDETKTAHKEIYINRMPISASIISPTSGEIINYTGQPISFIANVYDPEDKTLTGKNIQWRIQKIDSAGNASESLLFATGENTTFPFEPGLYNLWLLANDTDNAVIGTSIRFSVVDVGGGNTKPNVQITSPKPGDYTLGSTIVFEGSATDNEDGTLTGASLVWSSNIDGLLGYGELRTCNSDNPSPCEKSLSPGNHTITLKATDSGILSAFVSVNIRVIKQGETDLPPENLTISPFIDVNQNFSKGALLPNSVRLTIKASDALVLNQNSGLSGYSIKIENNGIIPAAPDPLNTAVWTSIDKVGGSFAPSYSNTITVDLTSNSYFLGTTLDFYVWFKDSANQISSYASDTIRFMDSVPPLNLTKTNYINAGVSTTYSKIVNLSLAASDLWGVSAFFVYEGVNPPIQPNMTDPNWISTAETTDYNRITPYSLKGNYTNGDTITLTVWFKDANNNISIDSATDTIIYNSYIANEDFNSGIPTKWSIGGDWINVNAITCGTPKQSACVATALGDYNFVVSDLVSDSYTLPNILPSERIVLSGAHWHDLYTKTSRGGGRGGMGLITVNDYGYFDISLDGGNTWQNLQSFSQASSSTQNNWVTLSQPLASYAGKTVKFRFRLQPDQSNLNNGIATGYLGWYLNNFSIQVQ